MTFRSILLLPVLFFPLLLHAQAPKNVDNLTDAQIEQFVREVQKRGLSESEIEALALSYGYSVNDIERMRERIKAQKFGKTQKIISDTLVARQQLGELAERTIVQVEEKTEEDLKEKEIFGKSLFSNKNLTFQPNLRIPTPKDYILGADDELKVDITGYAYQHYDVKVSPEGTVRFESLAPIHVNGLTIQEAKRQIIERLKLLFGGLRNGSLSVEVTLGNVRSIQVSVLGEAELPGSYTISSLSKIFNVLYQCGGPSAKGSFRNIKLIRNNREVAELDLYDFLVKGIVKEDQLLKDQDIIFIPLAETQIEVEGETKRNGIFELKAGETMQEALQFAGGFSDQAYRQNINITRNAAKERKLISIDETGFGTTAIQNGDIISVSAILDRYENRVEVVGAVFRSGEYALDATLQTLKQLIQKVDGLREDAFLDRALLIREKDNLDPITEAINLRDLMNGKIADIPLRRNDRLVVKSIVELRELSNVSILGAVNFPGEYDYSEKMTVNDLILLSGGFTEGATIKRIEIARRVYNDESTNETVEVLDFSTSKNLVGESVILKPFDKVFIRELPNYEEQKMVAVYGEVNYPGYYPIQNRSERIANLIEKVGGLRDEAFLNGAKYYRDSVLIAIDLDAVIRGKSDIGNLLVQDGDSLYIPKTSGVVKVSGQVLNPTSVAYDPSFSFQDYISQAGGYTDSAYVKKTFVRYSNGLTDRTKSVLWIKDYPLAKRGMEIVVPERKKHVWLPSERIAIATAMVSIVSLTATIMRLYN